MQSSLFTIEFEIRLKNIIEALIKMKKVSTDYSMYDSNLSGCIKFHDR